MTFLPALVLIVVTIATCFPGWLLPEETAGTWLSVLPALLAIGLAFLTRNVYLSLLLAILVGVWLYERNSLLAAFLSMWDTYLVQAVTPASGDLAHIKVVLFTLVMGGFVELTRTIGATERLVMIFSRRFRTRRSGQLGIAGCGLLVFFDDYANSLLLGTSFRGVVDRLRISRAKLAFLIDATAAPVAGLALISTWVGVELSYFAEALETTGYEGPVYSLFLQTIPYRFYPLLMLGFIFILGWQQRDFGPMYQVESECLQNSTSEFETSEESSAVAGRNLWLDVLPFASLLFFLLAGMIWSGWSNAVDSGISPGWSLQTLIDQCDPNDAMLWASTGSFVVVLLLGRFVEHIGWEELTEAMLRGMQSMLPAMLIMLLAWTLSTLCDNEHLNVAGFLLESLGNFLAVEWLPTLTFVLCAAVSFTTGSSWSTMGIMFPIMVPLAIASLAASGLEATPTASLVAAVTGSILAGSIWGDHCSPIADTTVLTSAATGCDHFEHVQTQLPYALLVGIVSIVCGTIPVGFGVSVWLTLPLGLITLWIALHLLGRKPQQ